MEFITTFLVFFFFNLQEICAVLPLKKKKKDIVFNSIFVKSLIPAYIWINHYLLLSFVLFYHHKLNFLVHVLIFHFYNENTVCILTYLLLGTAYYHMSIVFWLVYNCYFDSFFVTLTFRIIQLLFPYGRVFLF